MCNRKTESALGGLGSIVNSNTVSAVPMQQIALVNHSVDSLFYLLLASDSFTGYNMDVFNLGLHLHNLKT